MTSQPEGRRARVFISCGQQKDTSEVVIADQVARELKELGYEPYIAVAEQTLQGVQENIFRRLSESEYLLFIDFKRERLQGRQAHRGSLFSHQELALATYLKLDILAFSEEGILPDDGLLKHLQANCINFSDRHLLPEVIHRKVQQHPRWRPDWRNGLALGVPHARYEDPEGADPRSRFFHIEVRNLHRDTIARDCIAYVTHVRDTAGASRALELYEMKWKGVSTPSVAIPPGMARSLDAFYLYLYRAGEAWLGLNNKIIDRKATFDDFVVRGPGEFILHFVVFSANLPSVEGDFRLVLGSTVDDVVFERV